MTEFSTLLQQGAANAWLFIPSAILLGALHGLEPGHSKTMMAAFIIAVRGTVGQAVLLGLAATVSHTAVVWVVALTGLYFGSQWTQGSEAYLQVVSAVLMAAVALWMIWRTWQEGQAAHAHDHAHHDHDHDHDHNHDHAHHHEHHGHAPKPAANAQALTQSATDYQDAHELAHARDIERRFANRQVSTGQIVLFGLTGGLIPCPASITVLLLCLQLKQVALGATLVLSFSLGLALTMVTTGALAALSVRHVSQRWSGFGHLARKAPYLSGGLILLVSLYVGLEGWRAWP
jgi:ABC-type nickel/cobalt efflux system permease component RcnA